MKYIKADDSLFVAAFAIRLECLKAVFGYQDSKPFEPELITATRDFMQKGDQSTFLALDGTKAVGTATLCYITVLPTGDNISGKRAHLMNVYVNPDYRRQGIAEKLIKRLIDEARGRGVTEISLDATEMGRPLYERLGFTASDECMTMNIGGK